MPLTLIGLIEMPVSASPVLTLRSDSLLISSISSAVSGLPLLELDAGVQVFGVLADDHQVDRHFGEVASGRPCIACRGECRRTGPGPAAGGR